MTMFERLQRPFLTVETGEAYQPIRLAYDLHDEGKLTTILNELQCLKKASGNPGTASWNWFWQAECDDLQFDSLDNFKRNPAHPIRLGTLTIKNGRLYLNLPSFKRACLAAPFFKKHVEETIASIHHADFINKVFGLDERLPHGFTELFKDDELEQVVQQRVQDYQQMQARCEDAESIEEAFSILSEYTNQESNKRLPYAERYSFQQQNTTDPDVLFLGFYIFLRGRELVAIRRWFGDVNYTLSNAAEETMQQVFGDINLDIIE